MPNYPQPDWLAWAAGIVDGEGCIQLVQFKSQKRNTTWAIRVDVGNTDLRMLKKLREMFGGAIRVHEKGASPRRRSWKWLVSCKRAEVVLMLIRPWLITKGEQADIALASRKLLRTTGLRHEFSVRELEQFADMSTQMRVLKRVAIKEEIL